MYGKIFETMYTGSMRGSGAMMFAVWPYVLAHMKPHDNRTYFTVELNASIVAFLIGEDEEEVRKTIEKCCEPDPKSRTPDKDGRKLIKLGEYLYEVVNGALYDQMRRAEDVREGNRRRQEKFRNSRKEAVKDSELEVTLNPKFTNPTLEQCKLEGAKVGMPDDQIEKFFHYYESNGWRVGRNKMKSLPHAMAGWKLRSQEYSSKPNTNGAMVIVMQKEFERVCERMKTIRATYGDHQSWTEQDRKTFNDLKDRKHRLMEKLGIEK